MCWVEYFSLLRECSGIYFEAAVKLDFKKKSVTDLYQSRVLATDDSLDRDRLLTKKEWRHYKIRTSEFRIGPSFSLDICFYSRAAHFIACYTARSCSKYHWIVNSFCSVQQFSIPCFSRKLWWKLAANLGVRGTKKICGMLQSKLTKGTMLQLLILLPAVAALVPGYQSLFLVALSVCNHTTVNNK